ncbi:MAG: rhodanese-like domain-containing protein [Hyphomicrobiales bacterium]|nr:rhodanese-like domain-containing protein [Hyphomicrobiales bacterium]
MPVTSVESLVQRANECVETLSPQQAIELGSGPKAVLVDIRDIRELQREGRIVDSIHAPRGMLEFWFDPQCEYHRSVFDQPDRKFILFCAAGWRSALAAKSLVEMGFDNIAHIDGGFGAMKDAGATLVEEEAE